MSELWKGIWIGIGSVCFLCSMVLTLYYITTESRTKTVSKDRLLILRSGRKP